MKIKFLSFLIIQLVSITTFAQSKCYLMGLTIGKNTHLSYQSLILNEDNSFIMNVLFDTQYSTCGIYEINNNLIELSEFKINTENLKIHYCEEPDVIKNILNSEYETEPFEKLKIENNKLFLLNKKGRKIKRIKENFIRTNLITDIFGKRYLFTEIDCAELQRIQQN